jgi:hypothetical protein
MHLMGGIREDKTGIEWQRISTGAKYSMMMPAPIDSCFVIVVIVLFYLTLLLRGLRSTSGRYLPSGKRSRALTTNETLSSVLETLLEEPKREITARR